MAATTSTNKFLAAASAFGEAWVEEFARELEKKGVPVEVLTAALDEFKPRMRGAVTSGGGGKGGVVKKPRAKRPPSLYNLFLKEKLKSIPEANPGIKTKDVMRIASEQWKLEKDTYKGPVADV